jgi:hypothetical protein
MGIPLATTTYDTELDTVCTAVAAGVDASVASAFLTSSAAYVKEAAIQIATGTAVLGMMNRPGYAEAVQATGLTVAGLNKDGAVDLIKVGWSMLQPYSVHGNADSLALVAEASLRKLLAEARDDNVAAQVASELLKSQNEAAKLGSEKLLIDAQELKTDAEKLLVDSQELKVDAETALLVKEALTEIQQALKVAADAALSTSLAAESDARTALKTREATAIDLALTRASDSGETDIDTELTFGVDASEYTL